MTIRLAAGIALIVVPIAFNVAFLELSRRFDYPNILRRPPDEILRRFDAGGAGLVLRWQALLFSALALLVVVILLPEAIGVVGTLGIAMWSVGLAATLVQAIGLVRWPFAVPELARRYVEAEGPDESESRQAIEVTFATLHRFLGVGIGEHLGYLLTGVWTLLVAVAIQSSPVLPGWLGLLGIPIGIALLVGTFEFVGPNERDGWGLAGTIVPIAYVAWSIWLMALGAFLVLSP